MPILNPKTFDAVINSPAAPSGIRFAHGNVIPVMPTKRQIIRYLAAKGYTINVEEADWKFHTSLSDLSVYDVCLFNNAQAFVLITDIEVLDANKERLAPNKRYHFWLPGVGFRYIDTRASFFRVTNEQLRNDLISLMERVESHQDDDANENNIEIP